MKDDRDIKVVIQKMAIENQVYESWTECLERLDEMYMQQAKKKEEPEQKLTITTLMSGLKKSAEAADKNKEETQGPLSYLLEECNITVTMTNNSEYFMSFKGKKDVYMPSMILVMDYKDLSFLYFLSKRYEQLIVPEMEQFQEKINEQYEAAKEAARKRIKNMITDDDEPRADEGKIDFSADSDLKENQKKIAERIAEEIEDKFKEQRKNFNADFKEGEIVQKEDEETFLLTTDLTELKVDKIKLQFSDANLINYIGIDQIDSTPLI
jgi:hypothetical protein